MMVFKQLFDTKSSTYTYIISSGKGREALIIDPVIENTDEYIKFLKNLELKLVKVIDTHIHADHITGLNELNKRTNCTRIMGEKSKSEVIDLKIKDYSEKTWDNCRIYIRPSGTEPVLRVLVEAENQKEVETLSKELTSKLRQEINQIISYQ